MTSALDVAKGVIAGAPAGVTAFPADYLSGGTSWCQTFAGNFWEEFFGRNTPNGYKNATAAKNASGPLNTNPELAPPGAYHYFTYGTAGHVGVALGSGYMASGTGRSAGAIQHLGKHVYVHKVSTYGLPYLGWAKTNGARPQITGLTDSFAVPTAPGQRKVGGTEVRLRTAAGVLGDNYDPAKNIAAGTVVTPEGWVNGTIPSGKSSAVWFKINGLFSHSQGFTDPSTNGLKDLNNYPGTRTVRGDISNGRVRKEPNTTSEVVLEIQPNQVIQGFREYKVADSATVQGISSNKWIKFYSPEGWANSALFTNTDVGDLTEIKDIPIPPEPVPVPQTRTVRPDSGVNVRKYPQTTAAQVGSLDRGTVVNLTEYAKGDVASSTATGVTSDVWYKLAEDQFAWAGGFTSQSLDGLKLVTVTIPDTQYPAEKYTFEADFPALTSRVAPADWSNFENQYSQPDSSKRVGFPAEQNFFVGHQWGEPGAYSLPSVINTAQTRHLSSGKMSPHFVVDGNEVVQVVSLKDRAYHASAGGNDYVGIEIDPLMTPAVIANVKKLRKALKDKYGHDLGIKYHKDLPGAATSCGLYIQPHEAELALPVEPLPVPEDTDLAAFIDATIAFLTEYRKTL